MTDEQIKQNAEDYINENTQGVVIDANIRNFLLDVYLAGAHSRDEEIKQWKESKRKLRLRLMQQIHELNKLRNPLISVEDQLPPEFKPVIVMFDSGIIINAFMTIVKDEPAWHPSVEIPIGSDVLFWMHTPELKKGE